MPLIPGEKLGPYEIIAPLGAGGMGEVYRARDSKLKREVALKVLHADVGGDEDRLARFQREAEVLAALNHPYIAQVYGFDSYTPAQAGHRSDSFLIMELVEGEELSDRIRRGRIPLDEAMAIARQIVAALEAAHDAGIVHRDLKPGNIKVREDGTVKVLDFGLAKALTQGSATRGHGSGADTHAVDPSNTPTVVGPAMTMHGAILGTPGYMSPEQAKGRVVDKRADIWAFGCVLYEMLVGKATFTGETTGEVMAAIIKSDPDWSALDSVAPPRIRRLIEQCLNKDPRTRLRDIGDARILFDADDTTPSLASAPATAVPNKSSLLPWAIAAAATVAAIAVAISSWQTEQVAAPPLRFVEPVTSEPSGPNPVLSPDGTFIVYLANTLQIRRFADLETHEIPGTKGAVNVFISPDSRWIGFYADGQMKKVGVAGREPVAVTNAVSDSPGAAFVSNDRILFSAGWYKSALSSVSADGGAVTPVSTLDEAAGERGHWWPQVLPDGRHVLFTIWYASTGLSASKIGVLDLQSGTHRVLFPGARAQFADGHLLFYRAGQYHVAPFDPSTQTMTGDSKAVLPDAMGLDPTGDNNTSVSVASNGMVAYWPGELYPLMQFSWLDRSGQLTQTSIRSEVEGAALSPDDSQVVVGRPQAGLLKIWMFDFGGGERELEGDGASWGPSWHPDGRRIIYTTIRKGEYGVATRSVDGPQEVVLASDVDEGALAWMPDGRMLIKDWTDGAMSILLEDPAARTRVPIVTGDFEKGDASVSPDGKWIALCANPSGSFGLHVRPMTATGTLQRVAASNSYCTARWSPVAKELAFVRGESVVAVSFEERDGRLVPLKETVIATLSRGVELYGISRDGNRFLIGVPPALAVPVTGIRVITDGIAALQQR